MSNHYIIIAIFFFRQLLQLKGKSEKYDTVIKKLINRVQINVAWYKKEKNEVIIEVAQKVKWILHLVNVLLFLY